MKMILYCGIEIDMQGYPVNGSSFVIKSFNDFIANFWLTLSHKVESLMSINYN